MIKNEVIRSELEDYAEQQEMMQQIKRDKEGKAKLDEYAQKNHFLLSTAVMPGVFNSPFKPYPDEMEFHLRNVKIPHPPSKPKDTGKESSRSAIFDPAHKRYDLPRLQEPLPPVQRRPQGPFRDPGEVQTQRYKPFQPSLRVATNFYSLDEAREQMKQEEWVTRLNDNIFEPFSKKSIPYDKLLHTTSKYGHLSYGTQYYRHEFPDVWLTKNQNFQSVVPPIPIFEKLNDTYSQGQA